MPIVRTVFILECARDQKAAFRRKFAVQVRSMELGTFYPREHLKHKQLYLVSTDFQSRSSIYYYRNQNLQRL